MTNPSHQPATADKPAENSPTIGPAELNSMIAMLDRTPAMLQAVTMPLFSVARIRSAAAYSEAPADKINRHDCLEWQGQKCGGRNSLHAEK